MKTVFIAATTVLLCGQALAQDTRQLAPLPPAAQEALREEMRGNLLAINEILTLMAADKVKLKLPRAISEFWLKFNQLDQERGSAD